MARSVRVYGLLPNQLEAAAVSDRVESRGFAAAYSSSPNCNGFVEDQCEQHNIMP